MSDRSMDHTTAPEAELQGLLDDERRSAVSVVTVPAAVSHNADLTNEVATPPTGTERHLTFLIPQARPPWWGRSRGVGGS